MYLNQLIGQGGDWVSWLVWIIFFMVFFMFYPRLMVSQIMWKLESSARRFEEMSANSRKFLTSEISKKPSKETRESIDRFYEFYVIEPVSLDPYGIVKKLDYIIKNEKDRFKYFADQIAPHMDEERRANIQMGFAAGIELHMVAKIVRHYVELIKKTKSYQIAMIIQMQLPLIERVAKALHAGTKALAKGEPIGDGIGPWMVVKLSGDERAVEIKDDEMMMAEKKIDGRRVFLMKAKGPGGRVGSPGKSVEKVIKKHKIARMITIDAAAKLEGEVTGSVAEGVGIAMGGPGVERSYIEDAAVRHNIPMDSIIVKMSPEEAITPMRKKMLKALPKVEDSVKRSISRTKKNDRIIIIGVGNTNGVGNSRKDAEKTSDWVDKYERSLLAKKKKKDKE